LTAIRWVGFAFGLLLVLATASSVVRSLIVPRGLTSKITRLVARSVRKLFIFMANHLDSYEAKDRLLALLAPATLLAQLFTWLIMFIIGYGLMLLPLIDASLGQSILESGSSLFTLGISETNSVGSTVVHFTAAATGLIVVALQIGYLPTLYAAFNRRETVVTMLQSRAGAPAWGPEILVRHAMVGLMDRLEALYVEWERWAADVAESHTNYPSLIWFRSPHPLRSWVVGLLSVLDAAAMQLALQPENTPTEARLCLRMGFTTFRHVADFLRIPYDPDPLPTDPLELTYEEFLGGVERIAEYDFQMERTPEEAWPHFKGWRVNYESIAYQICDIVVAPPGPWTGPRHHLPGMAIVPERPPNRSPEDPQNQRPKAAHHRWHA
jgi:hypothetical protein